MKQDDKLTLFRRFSRWNSFNADDIYRVLTVLFVVLCIITCITIHNKYEQELERYNEADYKYLSTIVFNIWDENTKSIRIDYIPDNVSITEANISPTETSFKCSLNGKSNYLPAPYVNVHISEDFNVEVSHYTENEFRSYAKSEFVMFGIACCVLLLFAEIGIWWVIKISIYLFCVLYDLTEKFVTKLKKS